MNNRITDKQLQSTVDRINSIAGTPMTPYRKEPDGSYRPNALNYHLDFAYGGVQLQQMSARDGCTGVDFTLPGGHVPKRELYNLMQAYLSGLQNGQ
jgi:hypothetical protein